MIDAVLAEYEEKKALHLNNGAIRPGEDICLSASAWLARDLPPPDFLMAEWLSTTSRAMLVAPTGLGKTNFVLALAFAIDAGAPFLHWAGRRPANVLFIDGEMSRRLVKVRLADASRRIGRIPKNLSVLCRDDIDEMPPLDTEKGQNFVDEIIERTGAELVIFDNIMSLIGGDMKEEEGWRQTLPWAKSLTKRSIGQIWVHHTGHDETRSYGTKTREWQLDTVMLLERLDRLDTDIAFTLKFPKARERAPFNRADFEPVAIALKNDRWQVETEGGASSSSPDRKIKSLTASARTALDLLRKAIAEGGKMAPPSSYIPASARVVSYDLWRRYCYLGQISDSDNEDAKRKAFGRAATSLVAARLVGKWDDLVWIA